MFDPNQFNPAQFTGPVGWDDRGRTYRNYNTGYGSIPLMQPAPAAPGGWPAPTPAASAPNPSATPTPNIRTSIQPQGVWPNAFVQQSANLAGAMPVPTQYDVWRQAARPGVSVNSPMTQWNMGANAARGLAQAAVARPATMANYGMQNTQQLLAGQAAREQEALGWGNLAADQTAWQQQAAGQQQRNLLDFLATLYRWY